MIYTATNITQNEVRRHKKALWAVGIVLIAIFTSTAVAGWITKSVVDKRLEDFFNRQADQIATTFYDDMYSNVLMLQGLRGLWTSHGGFDYVAFSKYIESMSIDAERDTGFSSFFYIGAIPKVDRDKEIAALKKQQALPSVYDTFQVKEESDNEILYPVYYVEPLGDRENIIGLDFASFPDRLAAIEYARDNNALSTTKAVTLLSTGRPGFFFLLPLYKDGVVPETKGEKRANFAGVAGVAFRSRSAFTQIFGDTDPYPYLDFDVYQGNSQEKERLLYDHDPMFDASTAKFVTKRTVRLQDQNWTVVVYAKPSIALGSAETRLPLIVFSSGILLTILVAAYFVVVMMKHVREEAQLACDVKNSELTQ